MASGRDAISDESKGPGDWAYNGVDELEQEALFSQCTSCCKSGICNSSSSSSGSSSDIDKHSDGDGPISRGPNDQLSRPQKVCEIGYLLLSEAGGDGVVGTRVDALNSAQGPAAIFFKHLLHYPRLLAELRTRLNCHSDSPPDAAVDEVTAAVLLRLAGLSPAQTTRLQLWYNKVWKRRYHGLMDAVRLMHSDYRHLMSLLATPQRSDMIQLPRQPDTAVETAGLAVSLVDQLCLQLVCPTGRAGITRLGRHDQPRFLFTSAAFLEDLRLQSDLQTARLQAVAQLCSQRSALVTRAREHRLHGYREVGKKARRLDELKSRVAGLSAAGPSAWLGMADFKTDSMRCRLSGMQERMAQLESVLHEEELQRRSLHNRLQKLRGNIRVFCRVRPETASATGSLRYLYAMSTEKICVAPRLCQQNAPRSRLPHGHTARKSQLSRYYYFDHVFGPQASQEEVYSQVADLIISCIDGYNVGIMAYGQTGSGKTYTMLGDHEEPGIIRRALRHLIEMTRSRPNWRYQLSMGVLEIYQDEAYDLLYDEPDCRTPGGGAAGPLFMPWCSSTANLADRSPTRLDRRRPSVRLLSTPHEGLFIGNLTQHMITTEAEALASIELAERRRFVGATQMNISSSRSHLITLIRLVGTNGLQQATTQSNLILTDLAGSENLSKFRTADQRFQESTSINKSLSSLGRVFDMLRRQQRPTFRETKLTYLLRPTLCGGAKCLLVVTLRAETENSEETMRSIAFGQGAIQVVSTRHNSHVFGGLKQYRPSQGMPNFVKQKRILVPKGDRRHPTRQS